ncbi:MAG: protein kinase, partial [Myxococcota bacterium]|nr:protein kinase [Myxococcota bacterium]
MTGRLGPDLVLASGDRHDLSVGEGDRMKFCNACGHGNPPEVMDCGRCGAGFGSGGDAEGGLGPGSFVGGDRYEILRHLGQGGMGSVYLAQNPRLGKQVAVKLLNQDLLANSQARARMEREARSMARVDHQNVVEIYDVLDHQESLALVLEFVGGGSLSDRIQQGPMPWAEALALLGGVLAGLDALHSASLVHRDLKPDNILLDTRTGQPKITDLGIAHDAVGRQMTRHGAQLGTPEYMSPEQVRGTAVDARTDLYAAGIVLYEVLTGEVPFAGESEFDIKRDQVERAPDLSRLPRDVPATVSAALARALAKAPDDRYGSAKEMQEALEAAASDPSPRPSGEKPAAPRPAVIEGLALAVPQAMPGTQTRAAEPGPTAPASSRGMMVLAGAVLLGAALVAFAMTSGERTSAESSRSAAECRSSRDCGVGEACFDGRCEGDREKAKEAAKRPEIVDDPHDPDMRRMEARAESESLQGRSKEYYRGVLRAYNQRDREGYYDLFTEGDFCFYNKVKEVHRFVNGKDKRFRRYQFGRKPGS